MPLETFIVTVYCLVCEALNTVVPGGNPRKRGFPPKLSDAEALTMAFIGTVLGYRSDKAVWAYFRRHWAAWFPHLGDRSTLVRQWANLGHVKALLHRHWASMLGAPKAPGHLVDGFPVPVCHPKRVGRQTSFRGKADGGKSCTSRPVDFFDVSNDRNGRPRLGRHRISDLPGPPRQKLLARLPEDFGHAPLGFVGTP